VNIIIFFPVHHDSVCFKGSAECFNGNVSALFFRVDILVTTQRQSCTLKGVACTAAGLLPGVFSVSSSFVVFLLLFDCLWRSEQKCSTGKGGGGVAPVGGLTGVSILIGIKCRAAPDKKTPSLPVGTFPTSLLLRVMWQTFIYLSVFLHLEEKTIYRVKILVLHR